MIWQLVCRWDEIWFSSVLMQHILARNYKEIYVTLLMDPTSLDRKSVSFLIMINF